MSHEHAMLIYAQLAAASAARRQTRGRVKFLILTGACATRAGWPDVAARCQELITAAAPHHMLTRYESFADALRDEEFPTFLKQVERFCPIERAEHLLSELGQTKAEMPAEASAGDVVLDVLCDISRSPE